MARDIVCDMPVDEEDAAAKGLMSNYDDQTYYFCSSQCKQSFDEDPERFGKEKPPQLYSGHRAYPIHPPPPENPR